MYKILIKLNAGSKAFVPYKVDGEEYKADTVEALAETYKELLQNYTIKQIKAVQELEPELLVTITD